MKSGRGEDQALNQALNNGIGGRRFESRHFASSVVGRSSTKRLAWHQWSNKWKQIGWFKKGNWHTVCPNKHANNIGLRWPPPSRRLPKTKKARRKAKRNTKQKTRPRQMTRANFGHCLGYCQIRYSRATCTCLYSSVSTHGMTKISSTISFVSLLYVLNIK